MRISCKKYSRRFFCALAIIGGLSPLASASTFTVTTTADSGPGSLRQAILNANANPGADTILFGIGTGAQTIAPLSELPALSDPVILNAQSQTGFNGVPLIRIDGINAGDSEGLRIDASQTTVQGLIITRFARDGIAIISGSGNFVRGCYLGTDGISALGNDTGIFIDSTTSSTIGGSLTNDFNVISGNASDGIYIGASASNISLFGNRVGLNAAGTAAIANLGSGIRTLAANTKIGSTQPAQHNFFSGNGGDGIYVDSTTGVQIIGNYIGVNVAGTAAIANGGSGIVDDLGVGTSIGDTTSGGANVISGNGDNGIVLIGVQGSQILANIIGIAANGSQALPNTNYGIRAISGSFVNIGASSAGTGNLISGNGRSGIILEAVTSNFVIASNNIGSNAAGTATLPNGEDGIVVYGQNISVGNSLAGNVISGNSGSGISIDAPAQNISVLRNMIGLNTAGTASLGNQGYGIRAVGGGGIVIGQPGSGNTISGNKRGVNLEAAVTAAKVQSNVIGLSANQSAAIGNNENGIGIQGANNQIGGTAANTGNVIAANSYYGISLYGPGATGNHIEGNSIGTNAASTGIFPNQFGIVIYGANGNFIGGTAAGAGNVIANNSNNGIYLWFGAQNRFLGNRIYANQRLGIDLDPQGPLPNDTLDVDHGPNEGQNYPVVTLATQLANAVSVQGQLSSLRNANFRIEYFLSATCDITGMGQAEQFLGSSNVLTDVNGIAAISASLPSNPVSGFITTTATSADGNTSEFSPCIAIGPASAGEFNIATPVQAYEDVALFKVAIVRSHGLSGIASVKFNTADGTATAPADYASVIQTLTFAAGESIKIVNIPIVLDNQVEGTEHFGLVLSQPTGGAKLGANSAVDAALYDHDPGYPFYSVTDASVSAPDVGQVQTSITIKLSAPTTHTIVLNYQTADGAAKAGADYVALSGQVTFLAGETSKVVPITVLADAQNQIEKTFYLQIVGGTGNVIAYDSEGQITITASDRIFKNGFE
ncbi:hypothetical protein ELE36_02990 [Pseudolysobacter antarcticus]|uniref:Calx-beta domain-containing protein n=1 Tax=Pseudolysobacter antarcticus TaxID=2511995 RepID=A0A411HG38_9GAMM|nr:Calx-beta domain-containing protein [Pseudolysobacter antarcticus]QBB69424.1 hypothetical protein ELE36_02990 [Pseudolysobacter antarcticus]